MDAIALNMRLTDDAGSEGFDCRSPEMFPPPLTATSVISPPTSVNPAFASLSAGDDSRYRQSKLKPQTPQYILLFGNFHQEATRVAAMAFRSLDVTTVLAQRRRGLSCSKCSDFHHVERVLFLRYPEIHLGIVSSRCHLPLQNISHTFFGAISCLRLLLLSWIGHAWNFAQPSAEPTYAFLY